MNYLGESLKSGIEEISDPQDKEISKAMLILVIALDVGPNPEQLIKETGYSEEFVNGIATNMRMANLWINDKMDSREWLGPAGEIDGAGLFSHAMVALGQVKRITTSAGCVYVDAASGDIVRIGNIPTSTGSNDSFGLCACGSKSGSLAKLRHLRAPHPPR